MEVILEFLVNNYIWFIVISLILLFSLIGYLVDNKKDERFTTKIEIDKDVESRLEIVGATNITLNQMVQKQNENNVVQNTVDSVNMTRDQSVQNINENNVQQVEVTVEPKEIVSKKDLSKTLENIPTEVKGDN